jgi:hypothetical protein
MHTKLPTENLGLPAGPTRACTTVEISRKTCYMKRVGINIMKNNRVGFVIYISAHKKIVTFEL